MDGKGSACYVPMRDAVTQDDPLSMVTYGLGIPLLIYYMKTLIQAPYQLWYADNAAIMASQGADFGLLCRSNQPWTKVWLLPRAVKVYRCAQGRTGG